MSRSEKLWSKGTQIHDLVEAYSSSDDILLDQKLVAYDIYGQLAHVKALQKIGILTDSELQKVRYALTAILKQYEAGKYQLKYGDEDVHTRIENDITQELPEIGGKIHAARSRNDQILLDMRLFTKDQLLDIALATLDLAQAFQKFAKKHAKMPMPGYTHMQPGMLSSVGMWASQFAESLLDDLQVLSAAYELNDQSPLGSGAGYGICLPIDREMETKLLGFSKVQANALYCQNSRGKIEAAVMHSLSQIMLTLGRFASDILLFTTAEFDFFSLPPELTTGSSIMPQKQNVDIMELLRARSKAMAGMEAQVMQITAGLPSGYNRDIQEIKKPYIQSFEQTKQSIDIVALTLENLSVHPKNMKKRITKEVFATHHAYRLIQQKDISFREAYKHVGAHLDEIPEYNPAAVLEQMTSLGSPGNLQLDELNDAVKRQKLVWHKARQNLTKTFKRLNS